jgi:sugar phosphate isomerase/epimerase
MHGEQSTPPSAFALCGIGDEAGSALSDQVAALTRLGWDLIELRNVDSVALADLDDDSFDAVGRQLDAAGLRVACVDSRIANWGRSITSDFADDLRELDVLAERCARLGTGLVRVMSYPNDGLDERSWRDEVYARMRELAVRAEDAGLTLVHENCAGWAGRDADRMLDLLARVDNPALKLLFDTGNGVAYSYESYPLLRDIVPHVAHVHIKDAVGDAGDARYVLPGEGACRVADCVSLLLEHGYHGVYSIEPHINVRPHESLAAVGDDCVDTFVTYGRALENLLAGLSTDAARPPERVREAG